MKNNKTLPSELAAKGWTQFRLHRFNGDHGDIAYCTLGCIIHAGRTPEEQVRLASAVREIIPGCDIAWWNDAHDRTQEEVIAVLRQAEQVCGLSHPEKVS